MSVTTWHPLGINVEAAMMMDHLDRYTGLIYRHECGEGRMDQEILFDLPWNNIEMYAGREKYKVESWEPLTISPSLGCKKCGLHGWIREGQWTHLRVLDSAALGMYQLPVTLTIDGMTVELGSIGVTDNRSSLAERKSLAVLLRAYADRLDNES